MKGGWLARGRPESLSFPAAGLFALALPRKSIITANVFMTTTSSRCQLLLCLMTLLAASAFAQPQPPDTLWTRSYAAPSDEFAVIVIEKNDGRFALLGGTEGATSGGPFCLVRTDAAGETTWTHSICPDSSWLVYSAGATNDDGYFFAGSSDEPAGFLIKTDSAGTPLWQHLYTGGIGSSIRIRAAIETADGGYLLVGLEHSADLSYRVCAVRTNSVGDTSWTRWIEVEPWTTSEAYAAVELPNGDYVLAGNAHSSLPPRERPFLAEISASGSVQWVRRLAMTDVTLVSSVLLCHDGGYLVTGYTEDGMRDIVVLKTTAQGDSVWRWTHGLGQPVDRVSDVVETRPGHFVLSGWVMWGNENRAYLAALEGEGQLAWERMYGSSRGNYVMTTDLIQTHDGGFALAGTVGTEGASGLDMYVVRFEAEEGITQEFTVANEFNLLSAYPNPFNSVCRIAYSLSRPAEVEFGVYDVTGRLVQQVVLGRQSPGNHEWFLNGSRLASGTYFVRMSASKTPLQSRKVLLLK
jgi:hypothetical protein